MEKKIIDLIKMHRFFLITSHVRLDGDALGSELAMYHFLRNIGKEAIIYNQDKTPGNYRFLPGTENIVYELPPLEKIEVVFILDCSDVERVGNEHKRIAAANMVVNIDHHVSNGKFGDLSYVDHDASSTGELIFRLINEMGADLTKDMATNLYAAILTDTGGFRYRNTGKNTLVVAGHLVAKGADPQWISENIYENNPLSKIRLLARVLETLSFEADKKVGFMIVFKRTLEETNATWEQTEGFVDVPRTIQGVEISILFSEVAEQYFKLSLRSKGKVNVERIARAFGGGGHVNAAACYVPGDFETVKKKVFDVIGE